MKLRRVVEIDFLSVFFLTFPSEEVLNSSQGVEKKESISNTCTGSSIRFLATACTRGENYEQRRWSDREKAAQQKRDRGKEKYCSACPTKYMLEALVNIDSR